MKSREVFPFAVLWFNPCFSPISKTVCLSKGASGKAFTKTQYSFLRSLGISAKAIRNLSSYAIIGMGGVALYNLIKSNTIYLPYDYKGESNNPKFVFHIADFTKRKFLEILQEKLNLHEQKEQESVKFKLRKCQSCGKYKVKNKNHSYCYDCWKNSNHYYKQEYDNHNKKVYEREEKYKAFKDNVNKNKKYKTNEGLWVQSKGEQKIANCLEKYSIDFDYDERLTLKGITPSEHGYKNSWVRPDFYLTGMGIVIEYWGLKGSPDYDKETTKKKRLYKEAKQKFISIAPKDLDNVEDILLTKLKRLGYNF